jgi:hypothetical protein
VAQSQSQQLPQTVAEFRPLTTTSYKPAEYRENLALDQHKEAEDA